MSHPIEVRYERGIFLPEADLWLDPHFRVPRAFVSHAHSDHVGRHGLAYCTEVTREIMRVRYSMGDDSRFLSLPLRVPHEMQGWELRLLPAGHIPGSAMLHITRLSDGASQLYTGDFKLRHGLSTERCELRKADTLVMETTFGLPRYQFPPLAEVKEGVHKFVQDTLREGGLPVLLGYSLGKAQEILRLLAEAGHPVMLHPKVWEMTQALLPHVGPLPNMRLFDAAEAAGHVLAFPPNLAKSKALTALNGCRTAMLTGWALERSAKFRYKVDELFPLSDHADYGELLETVASVKPTKVLLVHGYTREFAADLRSRGYEAWSLERPDQLELQLFAPHPAD